MKRLALFAFMSTLLNCKKQELKSVPISQEIPPIENSIQKKELSYYKLESDACLTYSEIKKSINKTKQEHRGKPVKSISEAFKESLLNRIIPQWQGTPWSFEGHTSIPKQGEIACGYFVSTTLKHIGINLNRYSLAQQSPINEAKSLAIDTPIIEISDPLVSNRISQIKKALKNGIHFIGFDESHVGYILKEDANLYLIHSNYTGEAKVEIEQVEQSIVFKSFNTYHIVALSTNEALLQNWVKGAKIGIIK